MQTEIQQSALEFQQYGIIRYNTITNIDDLWYEGAIIVYELT